MHMTRTLDKPSPEKNKALQLCQETIVFFVAVPGLAVEQKWWEIQILNGSSRLLGLEDLATFFHHEKPEVKILEDFCWGDGENKKLA